MSFHESNMKRFNLLSTAGLENVLAFTTQAVKCYRRAALDSKVKWGRHHTYRRGYCLSYKFHKMKLSLLTNTNE